MNIDQLVSNEAGFLSPFGGGRVGLKRLAGGGLQNLPLPPPEGDKHGA